MRRKNSQNQKIHEILYGLHPVREAMLQQKRRLQKLYLGKIKGASQRVKEIHDLAGNLDITVQEASNELLEKLTGRSSHQGTALQ